MSTLLIDQALFQGLANSIYSYQKDRIMPVWFYDGLKTPIAKVEFLDIVSWLERLRIANEESFMLCYGDKAQFKPTPTLHYDESKDIVPIGKIAYDLEVIRFNIDIRGYDNGLLDRLINYYLDEMLFANEEYKQSESISAVFDEKVFMQIATAILSNRHKYHRLALSFGSVVFIEELGKHLFEPVRKEYLEIVGREIGTYPFQSTRYRHVDGMSFCTAIRCVRFLSKVIPLESINSSAIKALYSDLRFALIEKQLSEDLESQESVHI